MSEELQRLRAEVHELREQLTAITDARSGETAFSNAALHGWSNTLTIPAHGRDAKSVKTIIENSHDLDFNQKLNTSSYVNVTFEPEEDEIALMGLRVNLADQTVYPQSYQLHDNVVNMIANLWHCPLPDDFDEYGVFPGAGTVGSTEACLLAGLALKFRWRNWYAQRKGLDANAVLGVRPNIVISTCYQAAWEKLFKYMDVTPRLIRPDSNSFKLDPEAVRDAVDEQTIAVVCIMGNHYGGQYDPVWEIDAVLTEINRENDWQIGIHVDAASGGFIAPFQAGLPAWDFRLPTVLSISTSGHKYGESCCGTGWVVWRQREGLSDHVAISVTYLGGKAESYTLNFSRPASGVYVQYYKLLRYGMQGYQQVCDQMMENARYIREQLAQMTYNDQPRFILLDDGNTHCLPVVTAMLNPACELTYDDIDLQHVLSQHHWYVSGYRMGLEDPLSEQTVALFNDQDAEQSMCRIVVKANLTRDMAVHLVKSFAAAFELLDAVDFSALHQFDTARLRHRDQRFATKHC